MDIVVNIPGDFQFYRVFLEKFASNMNLSKTRLPVVKSQIGKIIKDALKNSPEYEEICNGEVYGQVGLPYIRGAIDGIIEVLKESIYIKYNDFKVGVTGINGGVEIVISLEAAANSPHASFFSENSRGSVTEVPWLKWLLTAGTSKAVVDYSYELYSTNGKSLSQWSRTDQGIMKKSSEGWGFPPEVAGVDGNNWITRALNKVAPQIQAVLDRFFIRAAGG